MPTTLNPIENGEEVGKGEGPLLVFPLKLLQT